MFIQAFIPYITFVKDYVKSNGKKYLDRGSFKDVSVTKKKGVIDYINLYAGPEVELHFRYSNIMNQIFVCFTYGLTIPMLFPITLLSLLNHYAVERYNFIYNYRKPPMLANKLNEGALSIMKVAPLFMLSFGWW